MHLPSDLFTFIKCLLLSLGCGGIFKGVKGLIHTPPMGSNGVCFYTISSDNPNHGIQLSFPKFLLRLSNNCEKEYIQIFEGQVANGKAKKYCGGTTPPVKSSDRRSLTIKFFSSNVSTTTEFFGVWESVAKPSGVYKSFYSHLCKGSGTQWQLILTLTQFL